MLNPITNLQDRPLRILGSGFHEAVQTLYQLLLLSLLLLGVGGFVFKTLGTGGWLTGLVQRAWNNDPMYALAAIGAVVLGGRLVVWLLNQRQATVNRTGDILVYVCLALGVFFGLRLILTGSL